MKVGVDFNMSYFTHFPKVDYDILGDGITQSVTNITSYVDINSKLLDDISFYSEYVIADRQRPDNVSMTLYGTDKYYWTFFIINEHLKNSYTNWPRKQSSLEEFCQSKYEGIGAVVNGDVFGKFIPGEVVTGQISGATGNVIGIYPSTEWVQIEKTSGSPDFTVGGETIVGSDGQASVTATSINDSLHAPRHFVDSAGNITDKKSSGTTAVSFYKHEVELNLSNSKIRVIKPALISKVFKLFVNEISEN